jgi:hypothetical protein
MITLPVHNSVSPVVPAPMWPAEYTYIVDNRPVKICRVTVLHFALEAVLHLESKLGASASSELCELTSTLHQWASSEQGKWIIENSVGKPWYEHQYDPNTHCTRVIVRTRLAESNLVFFKLKFT